MRTVDVILDTLSHFVKQDGSPPPGIPTRVEPDFERTLVKFCQWHSLSPIVLESLGQLAKDPVLSEFTLERLRLLARRAEERNKEIIQSVTSLARRFRDEGVSYLLMDDVLFALALYPSPRLRPVDRVTMLVRENEWAKCINACRAVGFVREIKDPEFNNDEETLFYYQNVSPCTMRDKRGVLLDLKLRLLEPGAPEGYERAWEHGRKLGDGDSGVMRVSIEDQLLRSCIRLTMSRFEELTIAVDVGLIMSRHYGEIDWSYIESAARARSVFPAFYFSYERIAECLGFRLPSADLPNPGRTRQVIFEVVWRPRRLGLLPRRPTRCHRFRFYFLAGGGWWGKIQVLFKLLTPPPEWVSTFFGRPCKPWLRLRFAVLALRNRLGVPLTQGEDFRYQ